jgi:hypothetical protein
MESAHIPNLIPHKIDTLGRGEAFFAGVLLGRVAGTNNVHSMYLGSILASLHSRKMGNETIKKDDIVRFLDERKELSTNKP